MEFLTSNRTQTNLIPFTVAIDLMLILPIKLIKEIIILLFTLIKVIIESLSTLVTGLINQISRDYNDDQRISLAYGLQILIKALRTDENHYTYNFKFTLVVTDTLYCVVAAVNDLLWLLFRPLIWLIKTCSTADLFNLKNIINPELSTVITNLFSSDTYHPQYSEENTTDVYSFAP